MQKNGKTVECSQCGQKVYKSLLSLNRSKNHFCSVYCANLYQTKKKTQFTCKTCNTPFERQPSEVKKANSRGHKIQYCSIQCRNNDTKRMTAKAQKMNQIQFKKNGLNKLEIFGREWLQNLGFILNVDFFEQITLFEKFTVDVFFPKYNLVVQFDGVYWHSKPKRKQLDESQDAYLKKCGIRVFRITDEEMKSKNIDLFQKKMAEFVNQLNPIIPINSISFAIANQNT